MSDLQPDQFTYAPICIFAYNRPQHLKDLIGSLKANPEHSDSDLTVFIDGPKNESARKLVQETREYADTVTGFKSLKVIQREHNLGLAASIISGVTEMLKQSETVIVLEDDLLLSPVFLKFMNGGLDKFFDNPKVASIHGYLYPVLHPLPSCFFLRGADCWGWATWRRAWQVFEPDGRKLLVELERQKLQSIFDFNGSYPYIQMLRDQIDGKNNSWAIRWHASCFLKEMLTLYPRTSVVENRGFDGTGVHCSISNVFDVSMTTEPVSIGEIAVEESVWGFREVELYYRSTRRSFIRRGASKIKSLAKNLFG